MPVFLRHLLPLSTSFVPCESFLSVWSSRQWKGNCLDQLSSICIFQRHHLSFKSVHSPSRTENNLWSHSFAFSSLKQKHFMPSTRPTAWVLYKGRCVPAAPLLLCSPVLSLLYWQHMTAAFGGFGRCERGGDTPCQPRRACPSASAFPLPWCCPVGSGIWGLSPSEDGCQTQSYSHFVLMHITAWLGTSVPAAFGSHNGCLQSPAHPEILISLGCWIPQIPTGFKHAAFSNPKKQKQASTSFLSSIEHVPSTKTLWQGPWVEVWHDTAATRELLLIRSCNEMVIWHSSNNKNK